MDLDLSPPAAVPESALAAAEQAVALAQGDARAARRQATAALELARAARDAEAESVAERALGLAARELSEIERAVEHLERAVAVAERAGLARRAAEGRMSLSVTLFYLGRSEDALAQADRARPHLGALDAARLRMQRALILQRLGRFDEALGDFRAALPVLHAEGDRLWEARLHMNRGVLYAYRGDARAADEDLCEAERLHAELGNRIGVAHARHNRGFVASRRGDVAAALELYDSAEAELRELGVPTWISWLDRCELLLSVRLVGEAREAASEAVRQLEARRMAPDLAEARLMLSHATLLDGEPQAARKLAEAAARAFDRQDRPSWAALARHAVLRARLAADAPSRPLLEMASRVAQELAGAGWAVAALDAQISAARIALALGRPGRAQAELAGARRGVRSGPAELRVRAWHAEALSRLAAGERGAAMRALASGLAVVDRQRLALGSTELRAHAAAHAVELAALGRRLAVEDADARRVLDWEERWRAGALRVRPGRPPDDPALAEALAGLRAAAAAVDAAAATGGDVAAARRRQAALERAVRARERRATPRHLPVSETALTARALHELLGGRILIELVAAGGSLHAVALCGGRARLRDLGPLAAVEREVESLRFALRRGATLHGDDIAREAVVASGLHAAAALDALLLAPLRDLAGDRELVLVPSAALHAVPWAALPSCAGRPLAVAPSATAWARAEAQPRSAWQGPGTLLLCGPGLTHAAGEIEALAGGYPGATCLTGDGACAEAAVAALARSQRAHIASHGFFRSDNPLFSSFELADGPLTVYDLERLGAAPRELVLSACVSALSAVRGGEELMGVTAALLGLGTTTVVGSVAPVRDDVTAALMARLHDGLRAGRAPAAALAAAQVATGAGASAFVCFGRG